ncbi:MAG TPA: FAD-binding protein, partial [Polyangiaceae bacterium]
MASPVASERGRVRRAVVIGGGPAGGMTALRLCEAGVPVLLLCQTAVTESGSVSSRNGIPASDGRAENSALRHFEDTVVGGDFMAHQPPVSAMTDGAQDILGWADSIGVPFVRTPEGLYELQRLGGSRVARTAHAGTFTGSHLLRALGAQLNHFERANVIDDRGGVVPGERLLRRLEYWEFLSLVLDDNGVAIGVVAEDRRNLKLASFPADGICLATGGAARLFARSTANLYNTGSAAARVLAKGAIYANPEFVQSHPTTVIGVHRAHVIDDAARFEGARLWLPRDPTDKRRPGDIPERERDYLLERLFPAFGNLVSQDAAVRAIARSMREGRGIFDAASGRVEPELYLDATHLERRVLERRFSDHFAMYGRLTGLDVFARPVRVRPAVHQTLGGLWVDYQTGAHGRLATWSPRNQATNIPGLYAAGDIEYQRHGAGRLPENELLSCLHAGAVAAAAMGAFRSALAKSAFDLPGSLFERGEAAEEQKLQRLSARIHPGESETAALLEAELCELMLAECGVERENHRLEALLNRVFDLEKRARRVGDSGADKGRDGLRQLRRLDDMLLLSKATALAALRRDECRGCHYKPAFEAVERDDERWLRTTLLRVDGSG